MQAYLAKRFLLFIPTVLMVTLVVFVILRVIPGDPALVLLAGDEEDYTQADVDRMRAKLGTDRTLVVQYGDWVTRVFRLDFGVSFWFDQPVSEHISRRFPITLELTIFAVLLATVVAIPLGVISAIRQNTVGDYATRIIAITGIALPNFWVAILIIFFLSLFFNWNPPLGYENLWEKPWVNLQQLVFPAIALGTSNMAFIARVTRSAMLEVLRDDYIRTARAKGLSEPTVMIRHALKNALLPVVTVSGYEFGRLLGGTVIIESIFLVPGMGRLLISAIFHRDFPMVQGIVLVIAGMVLVLNLFMDLAYAWLNPRIRFN